MRNKHVAEPFRSIVNAFAPNVKPTAPTTRGTSGFKGMDEPRHIDIVFDGPPSHESGRFVEVENSDGQSIRFGEWVKRQDGFWALRFPAPNGL